ncbi:MAG TPA: hypothetical protein PKA38_02125 [Candidatus Levybacteria bacterium]|nr:hypothetical protein [Candidatus Levybacteria bacterium]
MIEHHKPSREELTQSHLEAMRDAGIHSPRQVDPNRTVGGYTVPKTVSRLSDGYLVLKPNITPEQEEILMKKRKKA